MLKFKYPYLLLLIILISTQLVVAQGNLKIWTDSYNRKDFAKIKEMLSGGEDAFLKPSDALFFKSLFISNGEVALKNYQTVFESGSIVLKPFAAQKLMDYFYAAGYYVTATKYQKYIVENQNFVKKQPITENRPNVTDGKYYIQVGAFGLKDNARQQVAFLGTQNITASLVERDVNGKNLFCVWIEGKTNLDSTLQIANRIKQKYDLKFQIMKK